MDLDRDRQIQQIFELAVELPEHQQAAMLDDRCGDDAELRTEVESLLTHDVEEDGFLDAPALGDAFNVAGFEDCDERWPDSLPPGHQIGAYRISRVIARGGMGTVYEAIQADPRRIVALKLIRKGIASRSALRRFRHEVQILGHLQHHGIAQIYESGVYFEESAKNRGEGLPYFSMEYIAGAKSITQFASGMDLSTRKRLDLFADVCDAIHHGHQKGVIHRDLKPGNILVDLNGHPKIIDFGVARVTDSDIALTTRQTDVGQLVGTIHYMSPEQCAGDPRDIDTRSDVYSLGVVLYELLTGQLPYDMETSSILEATRLIREARPCRPSSINARLRGDIETIVLKAIEKDRDRRYQSCSELAEDIRRYLSGRPILAHPPSWTYLSAKLITQYRWQAASVFAGSLAVVSVVVAAVVGHFAQEAHRAREEAEIVAHGATINAIVSAINSFDTASAREWERRISEKQRYWEVRHVQSRIDLSIATLSESDFNILDCELAFIPSPDQKLLAIALLRGSGGGVVQIYDVADISQPRLIRELVDAAIGFQSVVFDGTGKYLVAGGSGRIFFWDWRNTELELPVAIGRNRNKNVLSLAATLRGTLLASADNSGQILLWDVAAIDNQVRSATDYPIEVRPVASIDDGAGKPIIDLCFDPAGLILASAHFDAGYVKLWDAAKAIDSALRLKAEADDADLELATLRGHDDKVMSVSFNSDGRMLASASIDKTVRIWDVPGSIRLARAAKAAGGTETSEGIELDVLLGDAAAVTCATFHPQEQRVVSGGADRVLRLWDQTVHTLPSSERDRVTDRSPHWRNEMTLYGHERSRISKIEFSPDGQIIASATEQGGVKIWLADPQPDVAELEGHKTSVQVAAFDPNGGYIVSAAGPSDNSVIVWDVLDLTSVAQWQAPAGEALCGIAVGGRGTASSLIVALTMDDNKKSDGKARVFELSHPGELSAPVELTSDGLSMTAAFESAVVSDDGKRLAIGDRDGLIRLWDVSRFPEGEIRFVRRLDGPPDQWVNSLVFLDPAGTWLAASVWTEGRSTTSDCLGIHLWNTETGQYIYHPSGHVDPIRSLACSSDGSWLASGSQDRTIRLWSLSLGETPALELETIFQGHAGTVRSLAFHPNEPRLASGSDDYLIKVWDIPTGIEVLNLRGHVGFVWYVAFDPTGKRLASASGGFHGTDNVVKLWETERSLSLLQRRIAVERGIKFPR